MVQILVLSLYRPAEFRRNILPLSSTLPLLVIYVNKKPMLTSFTVLLFDCSNKTKIKSVGYSNEIKRRPWFKKLCDFRISFFLSRLFWEAKCFSKLHLTWYTSMELFMIYKQRWANWKWLRTLAKLSINNRPKTYGMKNRLSCSYFLFP